MTDRSADIDALGLPVRRPRARRLGRGVRLLISGSVALALAVVLVIAWLQAAVLSDLPDTAKLRPPPGPPPTPAEAATEANLAPALADQLLPAEGPADRRALRRELLALKLRRELSPDQIRRLYLQRTAPAPRDLAQAAARTKFYDSLASDFAQAEHPSPGLRTEEK